ncbi:cuticle protein 16.8-like [Argiope bruennichi]|uniref:cuticle protein 16.8-like n=1 Tax=Argiope bruennichi TaxID=94029 RepID=UPI00249421EE|nr:cuticle protein 16.8-like [Argiope bruennichi]
MKNVIGSGGTKANANQILLPCSTHPAQQEYAFGYSVGDHHNKQHRQETSDGQTIRGSYGYTDARGIHRQVYYIADHAGFRAQVKTNEPGTANQNPASARVTSDAHAHPVEDGPLPYARYGISKGGYGYGLTTSLLGGLSYINYRF